MTLSLLHCLRYNQISVASHIKAVVLSRKYIWIPAVSCCVSLMFFHSLKIQANVKLCPTQTWLFRQCLVHFIICFNLLFPPLIKLHLTTEVMIKTSLTCVLWYRRMAENRDVLKCVLTETNADEQKSRREPVFSRCTVSCSSGEADLNRCATLSSDPILLTVLQPFVPHLFPSGEKLLLSLRPERHMEGLGSCNG